MITLVWPVAMLASLIENRLIVITECIKIKINFKKCTTSTSAHNQGSPQKKKSSGRSHKNLNLAREQRNNMFTVARARAKKSKDFLLRHNKV